ncbi:MAG: putative ABC transporter permease subunit [Planctomycetota bacterium]|jgi:ABC-2 type transport system permease protein
MSRVSEIAHAAPAGLGVLIRLKLTLLRNLLREAVRESPLKLTTSVAFVVLIWLGLFWLFLKIFESFQRTPVEAAVVVPVVFNIFFLALLALLAFSNAVLAYGSLFGGREPGFLLSSPIRPLNLVLVKYLETLFFSSWSLILLGLPLMIAMARSHNESWVFYPLFVAFFLFFVPIPGALGLLLAWLAARVSARSGRRTLMILGSVALLAAAVWTIGLVHDSEQVTDRWAAAFFARVDFIETALLPSTWVARGIERALHDQPGEALGYLTVTLSNALFASLIAVTICARRFVGTYDRATSNSGRRVTGRIWSNENGSGLCELAFCYMPLRLRLIAGKDLRTFLRDPLQWSQLAILFGLMGLYLLNLPRFYVEMLDSPWGVVVPFLNLCAVTLILATFTSRFVFPLVSLEGRQLWLIGLLPISRRRVLAAKFAYAVTVTAAAAIVVTVLAAVSLKMNRWWGSIHICIALAVCVGLCGLAVGLGARLPMFGQVNAGRIANSFGGTINLIASVGLVVLVLAGMALVSLRAREHSSADGPDAIGWLIIAGVMTISVATGLIALRVGGRHFGRLEL